MKTLEERRKAELAKRKAAATELAQRAADRQLSSRAAAAYLGFASSKTIIGMAKKFPERLPSYRIQGRFVFLESELAAFRKASRYVASGEAAEAAEGLFAGNSEKEENGGSK